MIYTAKQSSGSTTSAFQQRGISSLAPTKLSDLSIFGKPTFNQIAYSGYKDNLEAFLLATAVNARVVVYGDHYAIPDDVPIATCLPLPNLVVKLSTSLSAEQKERFVAKFSAYNPKEARIGSGTPVYTLDRVAFDQLDLLSKVCHPDGPRIESRCSLVAAISMKKVYQCITLFLRTNVYYAKRSDFSWNLDEDGKDATNETNRKACRVWYWTV